MSSGAGAATPIALVGSFLAGIATHWWYGGAAGAAADVGESTPTGWSWVPANLLYLVGALGVLAGFGVSSWVPRFLPRVGVTSAPQPAVATASIAVLAAPAPLALTGSVSTDTPAAAAASDYSHIDLTSHAPKRKQKPCLQ